MFKIIFIVRQILGVVTSDLVRKPVRKGLFFSSYSVRNTPASLKMRRDRPWQSQVDRDVTRMKEHGIDIKMNSKYLEKPLDEGKIRLGSLQPLQLAHFTALFFIFVLGMFFSIVAFIVELGLIGRMCRALARAENIISGRSLFD